MSLHLHLHLFKKKIAVETNSPQYQKKTDVVIIKESLQRLFDQRFDEKLKKIQERFFLSIQNVNNTIQEANKKITRNEYYINLLPKIEFFPEGKTYLFR